MYFLLFLLSFVFSIYFTSNLTYAGVKVQLCGDSTSSKLDTMNCQCKDNDYNNCTCDNSFLGAPDSNNCLAFLHINKGDICVNEGDCEYASNVSVVDYHESSFCSNICSSFECGIFLRESNGERCNCGFCPLNSSCINEKGQCVYDNEQTCSYEHWQTLFYPSISRHVCVNENGRNTIQKQNMQARENNGYCSGESNRWFGVEPKKDCGNNSSCVNNKCNLPSLDFVAVGHSDSIELSWASLDNENIGGYEIRYCEGREVCLFTKSIMVLGRNNSTKRIIGLNADSFYRVKMRVVPNNASTHKYGAYSKNMFIKTLR